ncbi:hypothetical protein FA95DRAFT_982253 [Auriscalpium vulgare]|uniref:Uncharacterized protein n=1 Tax=Auriscalpium vulgare TaxID=40419 RepID=A0ACB8R7F7_9AGAM|nr:hypothetical protein FA95DRAFT_982253 [Auriscalpium vulgare]
MTTMPTRPQKREATGAWRLAPTHDSVHGKALLICAHTTRLTSWQSARSRPSEHDTTIPRAIPVQLDARAGGTACMPQSGWVDPGARSATIAGPTVEMFEHPGQAEDYDGRRESLVSDRCLRPVLSSDSNESQKQPYASTLPRHHCLVATGVGTDVRYTRSPTARVQVTSCTFSAAHSARSRTPTSASSPVLVW